MPEQCHAGVVAYFLRSSREELNLPEQSHRGGAGLLFSELIISPEA